MSDNAEKSDRPRRRFSFLGWLTGALLSAAVALGALGAAWVWWSVHKPVAPGSQPYVIASGDNLRTFSAQLKERGVIDETITLRLWGRLTGLGRKIKAGTFELEQQNRLVDVLAQLVRGDVVQHRVSFIEGWRFRQWIEALKSAQHLTHTIADMSHEEIMAAIDAPGVHPEGRFFPDTYTYGAGTKDIDLLRQAYRRMVTVLDEAWQSRQDGLPLANADQALTLASIIEKETGAAPERPRIAGVFVNRLRKRMRLQTDPTVIYGLGEAFDGNLTRAHLRTDNEYNTYTRKGLPPTPIAMPGAESIKAALNPLATDEIFFVSKGDGTHQFSRTLEEHNAAVRKYQLKRKSK